ncbi:MAG: cyclophilin-like fold protein [Candidatus Njordarchaeales archaeon]
MEERTRGSVYWERIVFRFRDLGELHGSIRVMQASPSSKFIYAVLPYKSEAIVLDEKEILIKLDPTLKTRINRRDHKVDIGDIVYRPQIPALSIFAEPMEIYEPIEKIGIIERYDFPLLRKIVLNAQSLLFVTIERAKVLEAEKREKKDKESR